MTPHIPDSELISRHQHLFELLPEQSALLLLGNETVFRNRDVEFPFRQESSFWYFSRFDEPDAALLFIKTHEDVLSIIFSLEYSREREIWTGRGLGPIESKRKALARESFAIPKLPELLDSRLGELRTLFFDADTRHAPKHKKIVRDTLEKFKKTEIKPAELLIAKLRLYKSPWEIGEMRKAAEASVKTFRHIESIIPQAKNEREIKAELLYWYNRDGLSSAYPPIVASGENAVILHYTKNNAPLSDGVLLVDSGAEYNYYASDVTRVFFKGEKISSETRIVYEAVKNIQREVVEYLKTPGLSLLGVHEKTTELVTEALLDMKILSGSFTECMEREDYKKFFMHGVGHWLGLDVHDIGPSLRESGGPLLKVGMCFTIEPGLYFNPTDHTIPKEFRGIGIRVEDDVCIGEHGPEVLTAALAR